MKFYPRELVPLLKSAAKDFAALVLSGPRRAASLNALKKKMITRKTQASIIHLKAQGRPAVSVVTPGVRSISVEEYLG